MQSVIGTHPICQIWLTGDVYVAQSQPALNGISKTAVAKALAVTTITVTRSQAGERCRIGDIGWSWWECGEVGILSEWRVVQEQSGSKLDSLVQHADNTSTWFLPGQGLAVPADEGRYCGFHFATDICD
jgi:hypothetical protein